MKWNKDRSLFVLSAIGWCSVAILFFMGASAAIEDKAHKAITKVDYHLMHLTDGNDLITVDEIKRKILNAYELDLVGVEVDHLDLEGLETILLEEAFIVSADAYVDSREVLHIDIAQRTPILRVMGLDGSNYYLDVQGVRLPLSKHFTARVPIISGAVSEYQLEFLKNKNSLRAAFRIVQAARGDELLDAWLEGIYIAGNEDLWMTGNVGDFKVIFGDDTQVDQKILKLKSFFKNGLKLTGWKNIESINLKYDKQVITKSPTKV
jgi:cell division protein FtsQ